MAKKSLYSDNDDEKMHVISVYIDINNYYVTETNKLSLNDKWLNKYVHVPSLKNFLKHIYTVNNLPFPDKPSENKPLPKMTINGCVGKGVPRFKTINN